MADSITPNLGLTQPEVGQSFNTWGGKLNADLLIIDGTFNLQKGPSIPVSGTSATVPGLDFAGDTNTGIYSPAADQIAFTTGGTQRLLITSSLMTLAATLPFNNDLQNLSDGTTPAYRRIGLVAFSVGGTYTKNTKARRIRIHVWAGGGAGGGVTGGGGGTANACGGGGGGEYAWAEFNASDVGTTETVTVATLALGGGGGGANGNNSSVGTLVTCVGGFGAQSGLSSATATVRNEGLGGTGGATSGLAVAGMRFSGHPGMWGQLVSSAVGKSGWGGGCGSGGNGGDAPAGNATATGVAGNIPGGGGGGAGVAAGGGVLRNGGNGAAGYVLIEELA